LYVVLPSGSDKGLENLLLKLDVGCREVSKENHLSTELMHYTNSFSGVIKDYTEHNTTLRSPVSVPKRGIGSRFVRGDTLILPPRQVHY